MKTEFNAHGRHFESIYSCLEIEINSDGDAARVRSSYEGSSGIVNSVAKWQEIKYTLSGSPYVTFRGTRYHLDKFLRVK